MRCQGFGESDGIRGNSSASAEQMGLMPEERYEAVEHVARD
jgi:hypothetical protein